MSRFRSSLFLAERRLAERRLAARNVVPIRRPAAPGTGAPVLVADNTQARETSWRDLVRRLTKNLAGS